MVALVKLTNEIVSGAQVTYDFDVQVNPSESDIAGRIVMRPMKREYMLSVNPAQSAQIVHSIMALNGAAYALALRDYADNYQIEDELLPHTGTVALLGRTWKPSLAVDTETGDETTGTLSGFERILIPDTKNRPFVVTVNGTPSAWTISNFGRINISGLTDGDAVRATGDYLMAVCAVDAPSTSIITNSNGATIHRFADIRFRQIFENELVELTA